MGDDCERVEGYHNLVSILFFKYSKQASSIKSRNLWSQTKTHSDLSKQSLILFQLLKTFQHLYLSKIQTTFVTHCRNLQFSRNIVLLYFIPVQDILNLAQLEIPFILPSRYIKFELLKILNENEL